MTTTLRQLSSTSDGVLIHNCGLDIDNFYSNHPSALTIRAWATVQLGPVSGSGIINSMNVSSFADNGVGLWKLNYSTALPREPAVAVCGQFDTTAVDVNTPQCGIRRIVNGSTSSDIHIAVCDRNSSGINPFEAYRVCVIAATQ